VGYLNGIRAKTFFAFSGKVVSMYILVASENTPLSLSKARYYARDGVLAEKSRRELLGQWSFCTALPPPIDASPEP
jgi:hypothetical protein